MNDHARSSTEGGDDSVGRSEDPLGFQRRVLGRDPTVQVLQRDGMQDGERTRIVRSRIVGEADDVSKPFVGQRAPRGP
ncbi:unnamed protein product, partial [marine sediment metagenome]